MSYPTIGVVVVTHCAKKHLPHCLPPLFESSLKPRVLIVNSSSQDGTVELAEQMGAETLVIPREEFNHGLTREKARKYLNCDIVVMITPDAYATEPYMLEKLLQPLMEKEASIAYAKQIPHKGADFFEAFPRLYNYPAHSHIRGIENIAEWGIYSIFCSNSCAAYLNSALDEIGGFSHVLIGEDTFAVSKLLQKGHKIAYVAEAIVHHSHRYTFKEEFKRSFDTGLARKAHHHLIHHFGKDEKRGLGYLKEMTKALFKQNPLLIPYAYLQVMAKWLGYTLGKNSINAPMWFKKALSSQDFYWAHSKDKHHHL